MSDLYWDILGRWNCFLDLYWMRRNDNSRLEWLYLYPPRYR